MFHQNIWKIAKMLSKVLLTHCIRWTCCWTRKRHLRTPKLKTQKIQQPSIHINVRFYIISVLSQGDKKENLVFINYYFLNTGRKLFTISVRTKKKQNLLIYKIAMKKRIRYVNMSL